MWHKTYALNAMKGAKGCGSVPDMDVCKIKGHLHHSIH